MDESTGEVELYRAKQEMFAQQIAAKRAYEAKQDAIQDAIVGRAREHMPAVAPTQFACSHGIYGPRCPECPDGKTSTATTPRRYTREEVLLVAGAGIADGAAGVSRALASLDGLR